MISVTEMASTTDSGHVLDLARHAGQGVPDAAIPKPQLGSSFEVDPTVLKGMRFTPHRSLESC